MSRFIPALLSAFILVCNIHMAEAKALPDPLLDSSLEKAITAPQKLIVAGGCFWGVQAVFQHVRGVQRAISGYTGGKTAAPGYEDVSGGDTGHAEAVEITYDPSQITPGALLKIFFSVAHDPTMLNRQGPDHGTQYRSALFTTTGEQAKIASAYIAQMTAAGSFKDPIVTTVAPLTVFYPAETYHQDYARLHPTQPYIATYDLPKIAALKETFPDLYVEKEE